MARKHSEERQQLLLQTAGLGGGSLLTQMAGAQDHRIEVALEVEGALETLAEFVGTEGVGGTLGHGLAGWGPGAGVMAGS
jgi:hypothetical protein